MKDALAGMGYYQATYAIVITNQYFRKSARTLADRCGVTLWDRQVLIERLASVRPTAKGVTALEEEPGT